MRPCALTIKPSGYYVVPRGSIETKSFAATRRLGVSFAVNCRVEDYSDKFRLKRRDVLMAPFLAAGAYSIWPSTTKAEEKLAVEGEVPPPPVTAVSSQAEAEAAAAAAAASEEAEAEVVEAGILGSRIYDATVIGEPLAMGKDKNKVLDKMMSARIVYLGEAEQVPIRDDKELELLIVKGLRRRCVEADRPLSLALEAFPSNLQGQLDLYLEKRIDGKTLKSSVAAWPPERWQEYEPLLSYCRDNGVRMIACGVPLEIVRTVQAEGVRGLAKADHRKFVPPAGSGFISGFPSMSRRLSSDINLPNQSSSYGPSSYLSIQARAVEDYAMSQIILQAVSDEGSGGMLVVVTGASHVIYGSRGTGLPARISKKLQKKNQMVVLLDPERQYIRREGDVHVADFLWYSAARPCSRNCFDRAEIARIMNAAGRRREALPQDIQKGLDLGLVSPEVLQNFFDLEKYPVISELTHRFQGFRERLLADPKFLHRLAIEEAISITTTLLAQYEKRKENFFEELDYVVTDTVRGTVVDFFTVWLPAPTLSFLSITNDINPPDHMEALKGLLGSIPDNAFQKNLVGKDWNLNHRIVSVLVGGCKLAGVGFISSIGAVASSNILFTGRKILNPLLVSKQVTKRSPILKTALIYGSFLGISANLRYQVIAGIVEHRISEQFSDQTLLVNMISFVARTVNSYWGTQQWIDLARYTGLQSRKSEEISLEDADPSESSPIECKILDDSNIENTKNQ